ncbi:MAG: hypothetical protein HC877_18965 [Thioploca sp.]|nr:hypothetical protein [Thioploca sp.]
MIKKEVVAKITDHSVELPTWLVIPLIGAISVGSVIAYQTKDAIKKVDILEDKVGILQEKTKLIELNLKAICRATNASCLYNYKEKNERNEDN